MEPHHRTVPRAWPFSLALLVTACSGGASESPRTSLAFESTSSTLQEGGPAGQVRVVLHTEHAALPQDVSVTVTDLGDGSALANLDFQAIPENALTFPAGSLDGDTLTVDVQALDDLAAEAADETIHLALTQPTAGALLGAKRRHSIAIADDDTAAVRFAQSSAVSTDEDQTLTVELELVLDAGVTLDAPLSVRIVDSGLGSATASADYDFSPTVVDIPAGTPSGALFGATLSLLDDVELEGAESVVLELELESSGLELAPPSSFTLTITDDEAGVGTQILVVADPLGASTALTAGSVLQFGSASITAGVGNELRTRWSAIGSQTVRVELPLLSGAAERDFELTFDPTPGALLSEEPALLLPSPFSTRESELDRGIELSLDFELLDTLATLPRARCVDVPTTRGPVVLDLVRLPSPWAPDSVLSIDGEAHAIDPQRAGVWCGRIAGDSGSDVFWSISSGRVSGWLRRGDGSTDHWISGDVDGIARQRALDDDDLRVLGAREPAFDCPAPSAEPGELAPRSLAGASEGLANTSWPTARLALETDYQLYAKFADAGALTDYVTALVAATSARYAVDLGARLEIAYLGVHTSANDGWTTPDGPGSTSAMLDEFQHSWAPFWSGNQPVAANLSHFLSGASLGGGIAYVGVLCDVNYGFGVSANLNTAILWGSWSASAGPLTWDFVVFAHELGHNFGSQHTHSYCPPLDTCHSNCTSTTSCSQGTLMSYCHLCGGMANVDLAFHPFTANVMRSQVTTSCLGELELAPAESIDVLLRFRPKTSTGTRSAEATLEHDALNQPSPFELSLIGTSTP
ncbi:MAG: zinc-dependent metalloprotease [Planctomycetes bacterium]|nr:zinc-dependent metalloprotease [Planctomycetota bacterium]